MLYQINARSSNYELAESNGICIAASASLDWAISLPWSYVRSYCERKGWLIVPVEESPCNVFEFHGATYEVCWHDGRVNRITKDGEEINWHELPEQLKGLL